MLADGRGHVPNLEFPKLVMEHARVLRKLSIHDMTPSSLRPVAGSGLSLGGGGYCVTTSCCPVVLPEANSVALSVQVPIGSLAARASCTLTRPSFAP